MSNENFLGKGENVGNQHFLLSNNVLNPGKGKLYQRHILSIIGIAFNSLPNNPDI